VLEARISFSGWKSLSSAATRLPMFLARSPDPLDIDGDRMAPTISRKSTASAGAAMGAPARSSDHVLQTVDFGVGGDDALAQHDIAWISA